MLMEILLSGLQISVRGSNTGTVSDIDGNFVLYVEAGTEILIRCFLYRL